MPEAGGNPRIPGRATVTCPSEIPCPPEGVTVFRALASRVAPVTAPTRPLEPGAVATGTPRVRVDPRVVAGLVLVLTLAAGWRDGGFWPAEAAAIALIAVVLLAVSLVTAPPDRGSTFVIVSLLVLAAWWWIRSATCGGGADFLPLGASMLAFAAAFAATRALRGDARQWAALAMAGLGAAVSLSGFVGLIGRWSPLALPAQGLWRLSASLTYADAAGLACAVCLLLALGCTRAPMLVRVIVCLNVAGVVATQSRGAAAALACGCLLVPWTRYKEMALPLAAGVALGVAAVASSPQRSAVPWLGAVLVIAVALALLNLSLRLRVLRGTHASGRRVGTRRGRVRRRGAAGPPRDRPARPRPE